MTDPNMENSIGPAHTLQESKLKYLDNLIRPDGRVCVWFSFIGRNVLLARAFADKLLGTNCSMDVQIAGGWIPDECSRIVLSALVRCKIRDLSLDYLEFTPSIADALVEILSHETLISLSIKHGGDHAPDAGDEASIHRFADALGTSPVKSIHLNNTSLSQNHLNYFVRCIRNNPNISDIIINENRPNTANYGNTIAGIFHSKSSIRRLCINFWTCGSSVLLTLAQKIAHSNIRVINFRNCSIDDSLLADIIKNLLLCQSLKHLDLSCNHITDAGVKELSSLLARDPIKDIYLDYNHITSLGFIDLIEYIGSRDFESISLSRNPISGKLDAELFPGPWLPDPSAETIASLQTAAVMLKHGKLKYLHLECSGIDIIGVDIMKKIPSGVMVYFRNPESEIVWVCDGVSNI